MRLFLLIFFFSLWRVHIHGQGCSDSSYQVRFLALDSIYTTHHSSSSDSGTIIIGEIFHYPLKQGLILRLDSQGNLQWSRQLATGNNLLHLTRVIELKDGNIAVAGICQLTSRLQKIFVALLNAEGNLLWQRLYSFTNNPNPLWLYAFSEGKKGDLLVCWVRGFINSGMGNDASSAIAMRVDNFGNIAWSKQFLLSEYGQVNLAGMFLQNGHVILVGQAYDSRMPCYNSGTGGAFIITELDYNTGFIKAHKNYCFLEIPSNFAQHETPDTHYSAQQLNDGNIALFGTFFQRTDSTYFYKVLFNEKLEPYQTHLYASAYNLGKTASRIHVLPSGETIITVINNEENTAYYTLLDREERVQEQKTFPFYTGIIPIDGQYNFSFPFFNYCVTENGENRINISNNGTKGQSQVIVFTGHQKNNNNPACFREAPTFISFLPFYVTPTVWEWQDVMENQLIEITISASVHDYPLNKEIICKARQECNKLEINGPLTVCVPLGEAEFNAIRNSGCRQRIEWITEPGGIVPNLEFPTDSTIRLNFTQHITRTKQIKLIAALKGCKEVQDTLEITLLPGIIPFPSDTTICMGDTLKLSPGDWYDRYLWQDGSTRPEHIVTAPGTYWVHVPEAGCKNKDTIIVSMSILPSGFIIGDTTICMGSTLILTPSNPYASYLWNDGSTGPSLRVNKEGKYSLQVIDSQGCTGTETILIKEKDCINQILFPSAFTPNGDGKNEIFRPIVKGDLVNYQLEIFNRWGQSVFKSKDHQKGWNGDLKGSLQSDGVFIWVCRYQFVGKNSEHAKGTLLLLK